MKTLALLAALIATPALAEEKTTMLAYMDNPKGGRIELHMSLAPASAWKACQGEPMVRVWGDGINTFYGCWKPVDDTIEIDWPVQGLHRVYRMSEITLNPKYPIKGKAL